MPKLVSKVYGDALYSAVSEAGMNRAHMEEAVELGRILAEHGELTELMNHPNLSKEEKQEVIRTIFEGRVSEEFFALMMIMTEKGRFKELSSVLLYFVKKEKETCRIGTALISSSHELNEEQKLKIKEKLIHTTDYQEFEMQYQIDPALIGGIKIQVGDRVWDGTVQTRLHNLKRELLKIQLKAGEHIT